MTHHRAQLDEQLLAVAGTGTERPRVERVEGGLVKGRRLVGAEDLIGQLLVDPAAWAQSPRAGDQSNSGGG